MSVAKLTLDHVQWDALAGHLDRVSVAELVWSEPATYPGSHRQPPELAANARRAPRRT